MNKMKMTFALLVVVAVAGMTLASFGPALANTPRFMTVRAAETVPMDNVAKVCNEHYNPDNNNFACHNTQGCHNKGGAPSEFQPDQRYCTPNAYSDCPYSEEDNRDFCYCNAHEEEGCN